MESKAQKIINNVERGVAELRRGQFVLLQTKTGKFLVNSSENLSEENLAFVKKKTGKAAKILISKNRATSVFSRDFNSDLEIDSAKLNLSLLLRITGVDSTSITKKEEEELLSNSKHNKELPEVLLLLKYAELLPSSFFSKTTKNIKELITVKANEIRQYEKLITDKIQLISEAPLTLHGANDAKILSFRPHFGGKEHHAIIIGKPSETPLVRVHSSCFTGDLLASIKCDCRDQLQGAIEYMGKNGGGIIIYLMQEGRGIGLVNKLRAYKLQADGMDTVEANEHLGFDDDERPFLPAARILKILKVKNLRLLSNNPKKVKELEKFGIKVEKMVPLKIKQTEYTKNYLSTKAKKLGHIL